MNESHCCTGVNQATGTPVDLQAVENLYVSAPIIYITFYRRLNARFSLSESCHSFLTKEVLNANSGGFPGTKILHSF